MVFGLQPRCFKKQTRKIENYQLKYNFEDNSQLLKSYFKKYNKGIPKTQVVETNRKPGNNLE
jgi:hypothetical protein